MQVKSVPINSPSCLDSIQNLFQDNTWSAWFSPESSPIDWCEDNYAVSSHIAEFTNTFSNLAFVIIPILCINQSLWKSFGAHVSAGIYVLLFILAVVGVASAYFHATLSLFGQMLDEVSIAWILCISYNFLMPNHYRPSFFYGLVSHVLTSLVAVVLTVSWFAYPIINAYCLFLVGIPSILMLRTEVFYRKLPVTQRLGKMCLYLALFSIGIWMVDQFMCGFLKSLSIPGLHSIWHINIAISSYLAITVFGFWKAYYDNPGCNPSIRYWPGESWGMPYVFCKKDSRTKDNKR